MSRDNRTKYQNQNQYKNDNYGKYDKYDKHENDEDLDNSYNQGQNDNYTNRDPTGFRQNPYNNYRKNNTNNYGNQYGNRDKYNNQRYNINNRKRQTYQSEIDNENQKSLDLQNVNINDINNVNDLDTKDNISMEDKEKRTDLQIPIDNFDNLDINENIIRGIYAYGFETPSPIQQVAIRPLLAGYDIIGQAQSGFGKTATFCIGALGRVDLSINAPQILILSHTMELASQIYLVITALNKYLGARLNLSIKSVSQQENIKQLLGQRNTKNSNDNDDNNFKRNGNDNYNDSGNTEYEESNELLVPQIIVGTPGRINDMIKQKIIPLANIKVVILDEADELLSDGFLDQIKYTISSVNPNTQMALFSATMGVKLFGLTRKFMNKPINILVKNEELTLRGIKQYYVNVVNNKYKFDTLCDIYSVLTVSQTIIFCNNQRTVEYLAKKMTANNFTVSSIHGEMSVIERESTMMNFRKGVTRVLIATDIIGRGIDIQQVSIVINYE